VIVALSLPGGAKLGQSVHDQTGVCLAGGEQPEARVGVAAHREVDDRLAAVPDHELHRAAAAADRVDGALEAHRAIVPRPGSPRWRADNSAEPGSRTAECRA
jgi:hypothetical protein